MSEYEKLQLLKEAMAYYDGGISYAYDLFVEYLYTNGGCADLYTIKLAKILAKPYKASFSKLNSAALSLSELTEVIDFITDNQEGEKNV